MKLPVLVVVAVLGASCAGSSQPTKQPIARQALTPLEELGHLSADLQLQMSDLKEPFTEVDAILHDVHALPARLSIDPGQWNALLTAQISGGTVDLTGQLASLPASAAAKVNEFLARFAAVVQGLQLIPTRVGTLSESCATARVRAPVLAMEITTRTSVTLANPFASAADKARARADQELLQQTLLQLRQATGQCVPTVASIPGAASDALAKLSACVHS